MSEELLISILSGILILTGINLINSEKSLNRAKRHPNVLYSTSGIHPHNAKEFNSEIMEQIKKLASEKEVVAIGECLGGYALPENISTIDKIEIWVLN